MDEHNCTRFAAWLSGLLDGAQPSPLQDVDIRIVITDSDGNSAEVIHDDTWLWEAEVDLRILGERLGVPIATL